jgi:hypothetical protein
MFFYVRDFTVFYLKCKYSEAKQAFHMCAFLNIAAKIYYP